MVILKALTRANLEKFEKSSIAEYLLASLDELEQFLRASKLTKKDLIETNTQKIRIANLLLLAHKFLEKAQMDPLGGKVVTEAHQMLELLYLIRNKGINEKLFLGVDVSIDLMIVQLESLRTQTITRLIRPGNTHLVDCYHPEFHNTYKFKPDYLPSDYRSNFFFEVKIRELCPFTTLIGFHPYSDAQALSQEARSLADLMKVNINIDLVDSYALEIEDNIRALRVYGPAENQNLPGSYIVIKGGHHRLRALYEKFLLGEVNGNVKVLVQKAEIKDFPMSKGDFSKWMVDEIKKRDRTRRIH